jgi:hypothetical protein
VALDFVFIVVLTYALAKRKRIPAVFIAVLFVSGTLWSSAIDEFRTGTPDFVSGLEKFETADFIKDFANLVERGGLEVENGVEVISTTYENRSYEFGKLHWNKLVHAYFPGQVFGHDTKLDLQFNIQDVAAEANIRRGTRGATQTGMADCFTSFGFFGWIKYVLIGFVMGRWYRRAVQGDLAARLAYSTLMSAALHTISHGTYWLLNEYIHMAIFSYPVLYWARKPARLIGARIARRSGFSGIEPTMGVAPGLR